MTRAFRIMPLSERDLALHDPLELTAVARPVSVIGAGFVGDWRAGRGRSPLVGDGRQKMNSRSEAPKIRGRLVLLQSYADDPTPHPQLRAQRIPLRRRAAVHPGIRSVRSP